MADKKTRVMVVDDHPVVRSGLVAMINRQPDMTVCCEAGSTREAMKHIGAGCPDVAVTDLTLAQGSGMDLILDILARRPDAHILVLSVQDELLYAERVLRAGAKGYIMKQEATENLLDAIRTVRDGDTYMSTAARDHLLRRFVTEDDDAANAALNTLTNRELEVLDALGEGLATKETATRLGLSIKTVEGCRLHIKTKLGLADRLELLRFAIRRHDAL